jgi:hypothetical protein
MVSPLAIANFSIGGLEIFSFILGWILFLFRRKAFPLNHSSVLLVTLEFLSALCTSIAVIFRELDIFSCQAFIVVFLGLWVVNSTAHLCGIFRNYLAFRVSCVIYSLTIGGQRKVTSPLTHSWLLQHRDSFSDKTFALIITGHLIFFVGGGFAILGTCLQELWHSETRAIENCSFVEWDLFSTCVLFYYLVCICLVAVMYRRHLGDLKDDFFIRRDVFSLAMIWSGATCLAVPFQLAVGPPLLIHQLSMGLSWWVVNGANMLETFSQSKKEIRITSLGELDLVTILLSPNLKQAFKKFLESEWSAENLLFWEEVHKYQAYKPPKLFDEYHRIYEKYFGIDAVVKVHLFVTHHPHSLNSHISFF